MGNLIVAKVVINGLDFIGYIGDKEITRQKNIHKCLVKLEKYMKGQS